MTRHAGLSALVLTALTFGLVLALARAATAGTGRNTSANDRLWVAPDLMEHRLTSLALLPPAAFDDNAETRQLVEQAVAQALKASGHRWVGPFAVRDFMRRAGGDSLARALNAKLLRNLRVDSLDAPYLSRTVLPG